MKVTGLELATTLCMLSTCATNCPNPLVLFHHWELNPNVLRHRQGY